MSLITSPPTSTPRLPPQRMALLFAVTMVSAAGNTALMSVLPAIGAALKVPDILISLSFSWSALLWMFCAPYWARRSDRRGRKAMMALGLWGFIASMLLGGTFLYLGLIGAISAVAAMVLFMLGRSLFGLLGSAAPPAVQAYIASRTAPEERTRALSLFASSFGLGTVLGPALAPLLILPGLGLAGPCFAFAAIGLFTLLGLHVLLPDDAPVFAARGQAVSEPQGQAPDALASDALPEGASAPPVGLRWADPRIRPWVTAGMMGVHAQAVSTGIVGFLVLDRLALRQDPTAGTGAISVVMMAGALATLVAQWGLIPNLRLGPRAASLWGMAVSASGLAMLAAGQSLHGLALGYAVASLGFGMFRPGFTSGSSLAVQREEQGAVAGINASMAGSAFVVTPAIGVWLYGLAPLAAFGLAVLLCLAAATICLRGVPRDEA